ncbi:hypothetical protein EDD16DRAFT_1565696 [Pisolithus croceorrhizus]|nr:hypothetical protein EV401DRAFT_1971359 [Pisolithus croceorrhizus]KAI6123684.1 hypothetical protein EDD16DRAFT_1565696 [Pisolithus croceorrhizus]
MFLTAILTMNPSCPTQTCLLIPLIQFLLAQVPVHDCTEFSSCYHIVASQTGHSHSFVVCKEDSNVARFIINPLTNTQHRIFPSYRAITIP